MHFLISLQVLLRRHNSNYPQSRRYYDSWYSATRRVIKYSTVLLGNIRPTVKQCTQVATGASEAAVTTQFATAFDSLAPNGAHSIAIGNVHYLCNVCSRRKFPSNGHIRVCCCFSQAHTLCCDASVNSHSLLFRALFDDQV